MSEINVENNKSLMLSHIYWNKLNRLCILLLEYLINESWTVSNLCIYEGVRGMVFNATFNNISVISCVSERLINMVYISIRSTWDNTGLLKGSCCAIFSFLCSVLSTIGVCAFSFGHCIVRPSIYDFWLHGWYLETINALFL